MKQIIVTPEGIVVCGEWSLKELLDLAETIRTVALSEAGGVTLRWPDSLPPEE